MKTLKLLSIQVVLLLSLSFISDQLSAQDLTCTSCNDRGNGRIYISPLNLINPWVSNFQVTYGKTIRVGKGIEIQVSLAKMLNTNNKFDLNQDIEFDSNNLIKGGYKIAGEVQSQIVNFSKGHLYCAGEIFKKRVISEIDFSDEFSSIGTRVQSDIEGMSLKFGWKQYICKRIFFDAYLGASLSTRVVLKSAVDNSWSELVTENYFGDQLRGWNIPWNIKFGYDL